jgi:NAD/NADP transhydrogenase beta subunit
VAQDGLVRRHHARERPTIEWGEAHRRCALGRTAASSECRPRYGLAVAKAQYPVAEMCAQLRKAGVNVRSATSLRHTSYSWR